MALIADSTRALLTRAAELVPVGDIVLRGRSTPTRLWGLAALVVLAALLATSTASGRPTSTDKLAQIQARGSIILSTDPAYPPFSYAVKGAKRLSHTKCAANQRTANQIAGYDADTAKLVARALKVEACFVTPTWSELISGHWGDRWDIAFGSIGITFERMARLYYTQPYSAQAERFFVKTGSPYKTVTQLSGKRLGGCGGCAAQSYIQRNLRMPGEKITFLVDHATFVGYDVEANGLADVAKGKLDGFLCGVAVGAKAIKQGLPLRSLGADQYVGYLSGAVDQFSGLSVASFVDRVNTIVRSVQADGTLKRLSLHYFHTDFATKARSFDVKSLKQHVQ